MISKQCAILVFQKNPILGKVKTRLAATMGNERALEIYKELVSHTHAELQQLENADIFIYMSDSDLVNNFHPSFEIKLQKGADLGARMQNAFEYTFQQGYKKVLIIGTDCPGINKELLNDAFRILSNKQVALGPAIDGGYYLLGMDAFYPYLFKNITWSTAKVLDQTLQIAKSHKLTCSLLKKLRDIDIEADYLAEAAKMKI